MKKITCALIVVFWLLAGFIALREIKAHESEKAPESGLQPAQLQAPLLKKVDQTEARRPKRSYLTSSKSGIALDAEDMDDYAGYGWDYPPADTDTAGGIWRQKDAQGTRQETR